MTQTIGIFSYVWKQARDVRNGGVRVLLQKTLEFLGLILALPLLLLARSARPLVLVRFGRLPTNRIGMLAGWPEVYLSERESNSNKIRILDVVYQDSFVCNRQLVKMWRRYMHILPMARLLERLNRLVPGGAPHIGLERLSPIRGGLDDGRRTLFFDRRRDLQKLFTSTKFHAQFTRSELRYGQEKLTKLGVPAGEPFMCFHVRDAAYLEDVSNNNSTPHSTHQLRDTFDENWKPHAFRDASIHDYIPAAEAMTSRGYHAVRMGAVVKEPMDVDNPMVIDYASTSRSDFMDVFLSSRCDFFLCSQTGMGVLPMIFRRPCVHVNWASYSLLTNWNPKDLCIFKKFWLHKEQRFLKFREILSTEISDFELNEDFERLNIKLVDNTSTEILDVASEMDERLKGVWQSEPEDEELQAQFWALYEIRDGKKVDSCRVGAKFLRENSHLL